MVACYGAPVACATMLMSATAIGCICPSLRQWTGMPAADRLVFFERSQ